MRTSRPAGSAPADSWEPVHRTPRLLPKAPFRGDIGSHSRDPLCRRSEGGLVPADTEAVEEGSLPEVSTGDEEELRTPRLAARARVCALATDSAGLRRALAALVVVGTLALTVAGFAWACSYPLRAAATPSAAEGLSLLTSGAGPRLFCFTVLTQGGQEELELLQHQLELDAGVFGCEGWVVYAQWRRLLSPSPSPDAVYTKAINVSLLSAGLPEPKNDGNFLLWTFGESPVSRSATLAAWTHLGQDLKYESYDWVVKVEPSTVFFPDRLKGQLKAVAGDERTAQYVRNCNGNDDPRHFGLYRALEVLSVAAVQKFIGGMDDCKHRLDWGGWREDYFLQMCLDDLAVGSVVDFGLLKSEDCAVQPSPCTTGQAAFHPLSTWVEFMQCWKDAGGMPGLSAYSPSQPRGGSNTPQLAPKVAAAVAAAAAAKPRSHVEASTGELPEPMWRPAWSEPAEVYPSTVSVTTSTSTRTTTSRTTTSRTTTSRTTTTRTRTRTTTTTTTATSTTITTTTRTTTPTVTQTRTRTSTSTSTLQKKKPQVRTAPTRTQATAPGVAAANTTRAPSTPSGTETTASMKTAASTETRTRPSTTKTEPETSTTVIETSTTVTETTASTKTRTHTATSTTETEAPSTRTRTHTATTTTETAAPTTVTDTFTTYTETRTSTTKTAQTTAWTPDAAVAAAALEPAPPPFLPGDTVWLSDEQDTVRAELDASGLSWTPSMVNMLGKEYTVEEVRPGLVALPADDGPPLFFPTSAVRKVEVQQSQPQAAEKPPWAQDQEAPSQEPVATEAGGGQGGQGGLLGMLHSLPWVR